MVTIARKTRQIKTLRASFLAFLATAIKEKEHDYVTLLRSNLIEGFASNSRIGIYKSRRYAEKKYKLSQRAGFGNVDLRLTGAFYAALRITIRKETFLVDSSDKKSDILEGRYGKSIFILSDEGHRKFIRLAFRAFKERAIPTINRVE